MALEDGGGKLSLTWPARAYRLCRRSLIVLAIILLTGSIGSNLWLLSPWGRGMAERELSQRTGLEWEVGSMTWSPWNGFSIRSSRVIVSGESAQPVATITRISIQPYWNALFRGQLSLRELTIVEPDIELPLELLTAIPAPREIKDRLPPEPPALAAAPAQTTPETPPPPPAASLADYAQVAKPPVLGSQILAQQKQALEKPAPVAAQRPEPGLPGRVRIQDARMRLYSASKETNLCTVQSLSLDLPVSGDDAKGYVEVAGMQVSGLGKLADFKQEVAWKRPRLEVEEREIDLGELKLVIRVQLGIQNSKNPLPFLIDMAIKPQQVEQLASLEQKSMHVSAGLLAGRFRMLGILGNPLTWRAEALLVGERVTVQPGRGRPRVTFDAMYFPVVLQRGKLHLVGYKMLGEDLSILGNGRLSMCGGLVSVTRLVASPEVAEALEKSLRRAGMADSWWWYNMGTPDRKVRDIVVSGSILEPVIDAGPQHAAMPLRQLIRLIMQPEEKQQADGPLIMPQPGRAPLPPEAENLDS